VRAIAAIRRGRPISVVAMIGMLNTSKRTVQIWRRISGVRVQANFAIVAPRQAASVPEIARITGQRGLRNIKVRNKIWLARQIPSSLGEVGRESVRSSLRRCNRALRRLVGRSTSVESGGGNNQPRHGVRSVAPSLPTYTPVGSAQTRQGPAQAWEPVLEGVHPTVPRQRSKSRSPSVT